MHQFQSMIDALGDVDGKPLLIVNTLAQLNAKECFDTSTIAAFRDYQYAPRTRVHLLKEFPLVADSYRAMNAYDASITHTDSAHFSATGGSVVGTTNATLINTLGTCSYVSYPDGTGDYGLWAPQKYCRTTLTNVWTTTSCTTNFDCTPSQACQIRRCGCACRTNAECNNWFGLGQNDTSHACTSGTCQKVGTGVDDCDTYDDGTVNSSSACTAGACTNFCPCTGLGTPTSKCAAADDCRLEP